MPQYAFTILGSSSGSPHPTRATAGYALSVPSGVTIFDCGGGTVGSYLRSGLHPSQIERIIISHSHPDHVCELPLFVQMLHLARRTSPVTIHVPEEFLVPLNVMLGAMYIIPARLPFPLTTTGYMPGGILREPFTVIALPNTHLEKYADDIAAAEMPNEMMCNSLSIVAGGKRILYSSDVGSYDDIEPYLENHDLCLIETTHVDLSPVLAYAKSSPKTQVVLTHLGSDPEIAELGNKIAGADNVTIASDGMRWEW